MGITTLHVVIADSMRGKVDAILTNFEKNISKRSSGRQKLGRDQCRRRGLDRGGGQHPEIKIAVEFDVTLTGSRLRGYRS